MPRSTLASLTGSASRHRPSPGYSCRTALSADRRSTSCCGCTASRETPTAASASINTGTPPASPTAVSARASMPAAVTSSSSRRHWDRDRKPATFSSPAASTPIWRRFSACSAKGSPQGSATSSSLATAVVESRCARSPAAPTRRSPICANAGASTAPTTAATMLSGRSGPAASRARAATSTTSKTLPPRDYRKRCATSACRTRSCCRPRTIVTTMCRSPTGANACRGPASCAHAAARARSLQRQPHPALRRRQTSRAI